MTQRGSRYNLQEADIVAKLLKRLLTVGNGKEDELQFTKIGVVTPYRAQVGKIRKALENHEVETGAKVEVGTVHAFQGSEADVIIWNLVDTESFVLPDGSVDPRRTGKPGRLFSGVTGERVVNVAISRTKAALYVVGDLGLFLKHPPNDKMSGILRKIKDDGHYWDAEKLLEQEIEESDCQTDSTPPQFRADV